MNFSTSLRPRRALAAVAPLGCLVALALLAASCGGGPSPSVASLAPTTSTAGSASPPLTGGSTADVGAPPPGSRGPGQSQMAMVGGSRTVMAAYAACMRKNGEPSFPDPNAQGQISFGSANGIDPGSPQFQQAQRACQKLLPNRGTPSPAQQAQGRAQALAFSACMRANGVPSFPDPQFGTGGRVSIRLSAGAGLDPQSPRFQAAQKACQKDLPFKAGPGAPPPSGSTSGR